MKTFDYKIKDEFGIHARPAGMLVKKVQSLDSKITIEVDGRKADASKVFAIMSLGVKKDDLLKVTVEGGNEKRSADEMKEFFTANL